MRTLALVIAVMAMGGTAAAADRPAWCKGASLEAEDDASQFSSSDASEAMIAIVKTLCSADAKNRAEAEKARDKLGKKLHMSDADWGDAVAFVDTDHAFKADLSANTLAALTPIDQYAAIREEFKDGDGYEISDALYTADALEGQLSEVGRLAFLDWCVKNESVARADGDVVKWAVCQGDADKLDAAKLADQLRGDSAHDGAAKTWLRLHALEVTQSLKEIADKQKAMIRRDDGYKKIFDVAAKARAEWAKGVGSDGKLLALVQSMDSATFFHSRKQFEGCPAKTNDALVKAVSTIPAKSFAAMHDVRDDPYKGFASRAAPLLANTPVVNLAAIAFVECQKKMPMADFLAEAIQNVPGVRGPRSAALGAIMGETFKLDDTRSEGLQYPELKSRPYARSGGNVGSAGGVVRGVKADKNALTVAIEKTKVMQLDCVKEHPSNHVARVRFSGNTATVEREMICDKSEMVEHDTTWTDFHVDLAQQKLLKPGVMFSTVYGVPVTDVLAVWPSKSATLPSLVLGAPVK